MPFLASFVIALRGGEHGKEGQRPGSLRPGNGNQEHEHDPAQAAALDEETLAGARAILIDAFLGDLSRLSPLQGFVAANQKRAFRHKGGKQKMQQHFGGLSWRPDAPG